MPDGTPVPYQRPTNLTYTVDEIPPIVRLLLLGVQYAALDAFYLVLVAIIVRHSQATMDEKVTLMGISCIALAIGTTLQALRHGPVGSGYLAPPVFSATFMSPSVVAAETGGMRVVYGMTVIAGLTEALIGMFLHRLRIVITPIISGLAVFIVGLQLGIVGIGEVLDVQHADLPAFPVHLLVTLSTVAVCMALSIWWRGVWKLLCSVLGLAVGMTAAWLAGLIDQEKLNVIARIAWVELPHPAVSFGFDLSLLPAFLAAGAACAFRAIGVVTTCQRINNAAWRQPDMVNIRKGVLADGFGNMAGGLLGTTGISIGPSIVGVSAATGATSRVIAFVAAGYLLILGLSPKMAGSFLLIPPEVAGSIMVFTGCFLIAGGMQLILTRPADTRAIYIIGIATMLALSESVYPEYFRHLPTVVHSLMGSPLAIGLTTALILTLLFRLGTQQRDTLAWNDTTTLADVVPFLTKAVEGWKVAGDTAVRCMHDMTAIVDFLRQHKLDTGRLSVAYNGLVLQAEVSYLGTHEAPIHRDLGPPPPGELDEFVNEEVAVYVGLRDFLKSMSADRKRVLRRHGHLSLRLSYETP
jgi:xanthine permease XanP